MPDGSSKTEWLCDTLFEDIQEHRFKAEEQCGRKQVRIEKSCSADRRQRGGLERCNYVGQLPGNARQEKYLKGSVSRER